MQEHALIGFMVKSMNLVLGYKKEGVRMHRIGLKIYVMLTLALVEPNDLIKAMNVRLCAERNVFTQVLPQRVHAKLEFFRLIFVQMISV